MKPAVTFTRLGQLGRLGNTLWQLASTVGIARMVDRPVIFPPGFAYRPFLSCPEDWFAESWGDPRLTSAEDCVALAYGLWPNPKPSRRWIKYLQSPSLWSHCADEIACAFAPSARAQAVLDSLPEPAPGDVAVHVRRGDYLTMPDYLPALPVRYYAAASERFWGPYGRVEATDVHVYGDDPDWIMQSLPWEWRRWGADDSGDLIDWADLFQMARYRTLVIANSSYSWWAAFLAGPDATVVAPANWFGPAIDVASPALPEWVSL